MDVLVYHSYIVPDDPGLRWSSPVVLAALSGSKASSMLKKIRDDITAHNLLSSTSTTNPITPRSVDATGYSVVGSEPPDAANALGHPRQRPACFAGTQRQTLMTSLESESRSLDSRSSLSITTSGLLVEQNSFTHSGIWGPLWLLS
jgi:hypothetical protein